MNAHKRRIFNENDVWGGILNAIKNVQFDLPDEDDDDDEDPEDENDENDDPNIIIVPV